MEQIRAQLETTDSPDASDSEDTEEDDNGSLLSPETDIKILEMIRRIRQRDPSLKSEETFFQEPAPLSSKPKHAPSLKISDVLVQQMAQSGDSDSDEEPSIIAPVEQERRLRNQFLKAAQVDSEDDDDRGGLVVRTRTAAEQQSDLEEQQRFDREYKSKMEKLLNDVIPDSVASKATSGSLNDQDFLSSYLLEGWWKAKSSQVPSYETIKGEAPPPHLFVDDATDDDACDDRSDRFESAYNFRFEPTASRTAASDSVRQKDTTRKEARERKRQRELEEKQRLKDEADRLRAEKRKQLQSQLNEIAQQSGISSTALTVLQRELQSKKRIKAPKRRKGAVTDLDDVDMEEFSLEDWDRAMNQMFDDDYYAEPADDDATIANLLAQDEELQQELTGTRSQPPRNEADSKAASMLDELYEHEFEDIVR